MIFNTIQPMRLNRLPFFLLALLVLGLAPLSAAEDPSGPSPRLMVHLLDYLASDYPGAVKNGKILSPSEYQEQTEFSKTVLDMSKTLPEMRSQNEIQALVQDLDSRIATKADPAEIADLARKIQALVMKVAGFPTSPAQWPDLAAGKKLFENTCSKCHGMGGQGDGPSAKSLAQPPANFLDPKMGELAPLQVFDTVRLGVPGTPMAAFPSYTDQETWDLASYVISLRHGAALKAEDPNRFFQLAKVDLKCPESKILPLLSTRSDILLAQDLTGTDLERSKKLDALRLRSGVETSQASIDFARFNLQEALSDYTAGHPESASRKALQAYVDGVEPVEPRLKANDPQFVSNLEQLMGFARSNINGRKPLVEVDASIQKALLGLDQASTLLKSQAPSPWLTFTLCFGIILREGFEALLLITALLGVIRASGAQKARRWVHGGWIAAVGLGFLAWFFAGWLMGFSGLGREMMEGITGALTVAILLYIGFWLHSRTEVTRWKSFIQGSIQTALEERNLLRLALISFLAAFREAIETVLFLRALWLEGGPDSGLFLGLGVLAAFAAILILGWLLLTFSAKIPIKTVFNASSIIMIALAVILTGKAIHSFQEVDLISITFSPLSFHWDWVGLYPTREVLLGQCLVLALSLVLWVWGKKAPTSK